MSTPVFGSTLCTACNGKGALPWGPCSCADGWILPGREIPTLPAPKPKDVPTPISNSSVPQRQPTAATGDARPGARERDEAMERVRQGMWGRLALQALTIVAEEHDDLTTMDVWAELKRRGVTPPSEHRAMGPVMKDAEKAGLITPTDRFRPSDDPRQHRRPLRVFRSNVRR